MMIYASQGSVFVELRIMSSEADAADVNPPCRGDACHGADVKPSIVIVQDIDLVSNCVFHEPLLNLKLFAIRENEIVLLVHGMHDLHTIQRLHYVRADAAI